MSGPIATLTLSFLLDHPESAARVLDELDPTAAADIFRSLPARVAAPLLARMQPEQAAGVIGRLDPALGASMVRAMPHMDCVTVLRLVSDEERMSIFTALPSRTSRDVTKSLAYPLDTVGAWMEYSIAAFRASSRVADARRFVQRNHARTLSHVFVIGSGRHLQGAVPLTRLLHLAGDTALGEVLDTAVTPLSNRARVTEVSRLEAWDEFATLPVIGRKGNVLGGLSRLNLRRALLQARPDSDQVVPSGAGAQVLNAWLLSAAGMFKALTGQRLQ